MEEPLIKVVFLGDSGVGKTCIINRFVRSTFDESSMPTAGAKYDSKLVEIPGTSKSIKFQIWDTAGQELYRCLAPIYYRNAEAAVLVYDITQPSSFDGINYWVKQLKDNTEGNIKIAMAANKSDLVEQQAVSVEKAQKLAEENKAILKSVSAKEGTGIDELFAQLAKEILGVSVTQAVNF